MGPVISHIVDPDDIITLCRACGYTNERRWHASCPDCHSKDVVKPILLHYSEDREDQVA